MLVDFDHNLNIAINKLRAALNDLAEQPSSSKPFRAGDTEELQSIS
jgi:hypothetical protein